MFINFKNSFTSKLSDKLVVKQHITTEMLGYTTLWLISMHFLVSLVFWHSYISQGSVATCSWRGGICKKDFFANLLPTLAVKNFWKSINIWWSYGQEFSVWFFSDSQCRLRQRSSGQRAKDLDWEATAFLERCRPRHHWYTEIRQRS